MVPILIRPPSRSQRPAPDTSSDSVDPLKRPLPEFLLLLTLAAVQFTIAVDFVIMMPLGPQLISIFQVTTPAFNGAVSAYATAAGISGLIGALFLDRFDRKSALLFIYAGFAIGTFFCGVAPTFELLVVARAVAGVFGGIVGGVSLSIVGDLVPNARRASAMGMVMSSFSVAQIAGVPLGLYLADKFSWHVPFTGLAALSGVIWLIALWRLPRVQGHLAISRQETPWTRFKGVLANADHLRALALMAVITFGGFMIIPDLADYLVANVGLTQEQLPWIYLVGGATTLFSMNFVGWLADRYGRFRVFAIMMTCSIGASLLVTHLAPSPLPLVIVATTTFMVCMSGRFVPAITMITSSVEPEHRGGFMSVNSAVAQFCSGLAASFAGLLIADTSDHQLRGFGTCGWLYIGWAILGFWLASRLRTGGTEVRGPDLDSTAGEEGMLPPSSGGCRTTARQA